MIKEHPRNDSWFEHWSKCKILSFSGDDYLMPLIFHQFHPAAVLILSDLVLLLLLQKPLVKTQVLFVSKIFCSPLFFAGDVKLTTFWCGLILHAEDGKPVFRSKWLAIGQGLLKLLWTVYSEEKLQSSLKLRKFNLLIRISRYVYKKY